MILFSIGLPGRLADWCDAVLTRLLSGSTDEVAVITWPRLAAMLVNAEVNPVLDQTAISLIETGATHLVIGVRKPDVRLREALAITNARFLVALDDPRCVVADILANSNGDLQTVTRAIANSCSLVMQYASLAGVIPIRGYEADPDAVGVVAAIARHFDLALDDGEAKHVVDELASRGLLYSPRSLGKSADPSPVTGGSLVEGALGAYARWFAGGDLGAIIWSRELFIVGGDSANRLTDPLDVPGGARILIFGPYIHLPAGSWTAQVVLGFSAEAVGHTFLVDAVSNRQLGSTSFQPLRAGIYNVDISFWLDEPSGPGVEIRIWVLSNGAQGQVAFGHVVLRPMLMRQPDAIAGSQDFRTVLNL